jgi:hypothetical protein
MNSARCLTTCSRSLAASAPSLHSSAAATAQFWAVAVRRDRALPPAQLDLAVELEPLGQFVQFVPVFVGVVAHDHATAQHHELAHVVGGQRARLLCALEYAHPGGLGGASTLA